MKKDKAKRDKEAIDRGSIPSFGNNPWEKDLPKFFQMQDQERAEEEERQPAHGQPVHGQPAHRQRQLEQQDHIGMAY